MATGSGELPGPDWPAGFRLVEHFIAGTGPRKTDANFHTSCGINLKAPFADWQKAYDAWAAGAVDGKYSYSRFTWTICGATPKPSESPSFNPNLTPVPTRTPAPTRPPGPTRKP